MQASSETLAASAVAVAMCLAACAPSPKPAPVATAPTPVPYSCQQQQRLAAELAALPPGAVIGTMIGDYLAMRRQARAALGLPEPEACAP
jgi:hypothetical protein